MAHEIKKPTENKEKRYIQHVKNENEYIERALRCFIYLKQDKMHLLSILITIQL